MSQYFFSKVVFISTITAIHIISLFVMVEETAICVSAEGLFYLLMNNKIINQNFYHFMKWQNKNIKNKLNY